VIRVSAENFKRLKVIDFHPNRYVTKISGANAAGKTSALDAIFQALVPRKTLSPALIREGERRGFIRLETNSHIIRRELDGRGGNLGIAIKVDNNEIDIADPETWLKEMAGKMGKMGIDPLRFKGLEPEEQFNHLKTLVPLDIEELELRNKNDSETITTRKAEMKRLKAARDHYRIDTTLPTEPTDIDALLAEARSARAINAEREEKQRQYDREDYEQQRCLTEMQSIEEQIAELNARMSTLAERHGYMTQSQKERQPLPEPKHTQELEDKISSASALNSQITLNNANRETRNNYDLQADAIQDQLDKLEKNIRERKLEIGDALDKAEWPIAGLGFAIEAEDRSGRELKNPKKIVTYNGLPLSEASSGEQIRISTAIGMAAKPELRFLLIREGSLLDDAGMAIIEKMAHENDFQIFCEVVDTTGKVGIFMEDGTISAVNQEPEPEPAKPVKPAKAAKKRVAVKD
jgi:hypothetical protein